MTNLNVPVSSSLQKKKEERNWEYRGFFFTVSVAREKVKDHPTSNQVKRILLMI